jgi:hypothetical protein
MRRTDVTRSIRGSRRATVLLASAAAAATLLLSGCGTGQISETAAMRPAVTGINAQTADNMFKIRNLTVSYPGVDGYPVGANAPLETVIYNDSDRAVTLTVTTSSGRSVVLIGATGTPTPAATANVRPSTTASPSGSASASPSGSSPAGSVSTSPSGTTPSGSVSASPSATVAPPPPADVPASIQIPASGFVVLSRAAGKFLQVNRLNSELKPGQSIDLVFAFDGTELKTPALVSLPSTAAPRGTPDKPATSGGHGG